MVKWRNGGIKDLFLVSSNILLIKQIKKDAILNTERAYKKAPSSTLLASILKSRVRVTVVKERSSANFSF